MKERLPKLLPEAGGKSIQWGDRRRLMWEERALLSASRSGPGILPSTQEPAEALAALIPRKYSGTPGWNPAILDDPAAAEGISKVWEQWLKERLPRILPEAEGVATSWGDGRRLLWEQRKMLSSLSGQGGASA